jgi:molybdopterin/thiamine biosynthesis adenylyltransferase
MKLWWLTDSTRLALERRAVESLTGEGWFALSRFGFFAGRFGAEGIITVHGHAYPVRLVYPDQFPLVPAWVEPQDPTVRWSLHQYGAGGILCLELRPDTWHPAATGADVLRSAYHLLEIEDPLGKGEATAPSAHRVDPMQGYLWNGQPVLVSEGCLARLVTGQATGLAALRWMADDGLWPVMLFDDAQRATPDHPPSFDFGTLRGEVTVRLGSRIPATEPTTRAELAEATGADLAGIADNVPVVVVALEGGIPVPYHSFDHEHAHRRNWVLLPDDAGLRSGRDPAAHAKKVAVVGLGSVGAKLTETLVRSGVRRLLTVDGDVFLPGNLERHTLDWRDVGFRKVGAVTRRLQHIVPGVEVESITANLDWQRSAKVYADDLDKLASCDLIVDATGSVPTALLLGAIAAGNGIPFVSVAVYEGGLGAVIGRALPGRDPTFADGRAEYLDYCARAGVEPPKSGTRPYEATEEDGTPIVADDAAVSMAAAHAARVTLDVLDGRVGDDDATWLLLGFRKGWLFQRHGESISLTMPPPPSVELAVDEDAIAFALQLAEEAVDATAPAA